MSEPTRTPGLFITGTNTEVGKTYIASAIARSLVAQGKNVGVYKPAASGCVERDGQRVSEDALELWKAADRPGTLLEVCPQQFAAPIAPHLAARREGREIDTELLRGGLDIWRERSEIVIVEGAGGLMSPIGDDDFVADLAFEFGFPLIVVAPNSLGVINQTLQTLITAATFRDGLDVAGIVFNDISPSDGQDISRDSNAAELAARSVAPILARMQWQASEFDTDVDWFALAGVRTVSHG